MKHWKHYKALLNAYDVIMKNNGKVCDVRSLAGKIKGLNGHVPGTWKWTIAGKKHQENFCHIVVVSVLVSCRQKL